MKKLTLLIIPLMTLSFLASCNKSLGTPKPLEECSWEKISQVSKANKASEWFKIGDTKKVQLRHQDLNSNGIIDEGEIYQTVRIIGFNQDVNEKNKKIGITFEFADLICDKVGYSLAAYWHDTNETETSNYDYTSSSIRLALNSKNDPSISWYQYFGLQHDKDTNKKYSTAFSGKSVLYMLPDSLRENIRNAKKLINIGSGPADSPTWTETEFTDKLFLLSPREMGYIQDDEIEYHKYQEPNTFIYSYYEGHKTRWEDVRVKGQIKGADGARVDILTPVEDGKYEGDIKCSSAGFNFKNLESRNNEIEYGGLYYLRSPYTQPGVKSNAWFASSFNGFMNETYVYYSAYSIAPAFCI